MYAKGALTTTQHDLRYSSMDSIIAAKSYLLIFGSTLGSLYSSSSYFWLAKKCTVSLSISVISQSKVHLHLLWNKKATSFRFSCAVTDLLPSVGSLIGILATWFSMTLQMSLTLLSVRMLSFSVLSSPCYLTSNLASLGLNPSWMYICWSFKAIISGPCTVCTHRIPI